MMGSWVDDGTRRVVGVALALLLPLAASCASIGIGGAADDVPATAILYVANQDDATVTLIDTRSNEIMRTVDLKALGYGPNAKPHHIVVEPDGSYWYVSLIGENRIAKIDRNDRVVAEAVFEAAGMMALHKTRDLLFIGRSMTAVNPPQRIGVVTRSSMEIDELPIFFSRPHAIAVNSVADVAYSASLAVNQIAAIDWQQEEVKLHAIDGPQHALMMYALSPDLRTLVISGELSGELLVFDVSEPLQPRLDGRIDVGMQPFDPIFTRDGRYVYFGNKLMDRVSIVDMQTRTVVKTLQHEGIRQPHGVALSTDGRWLYVSNNNLGSQAGRMMAADHSAHMGAAPQGEPGLGTVVVIDTQTQEVAKVITVGRNASGINTATR
jgi:DNA-binding beta-propeller fold protein YncE